jgi:hypothetical protein
MPSPMDLPEGVRSFSRIPREQLSAGKDSDTGQIHWGQIKASSTVSTQERQTKGNIVIFDLVVGHPTFLSPSDIQTSGD